MKYDAFFSYSHKHDRDVARQLQAEVERYGKPRRQLRARAIFVDKTAVAAGAPLWPTIEAALEQSSSFVLIASPEAASSPWVAREVAWWLRNRGPERLAIVVVRGTVAWDERTNDFAADSSAVPAVLRDTLGQQPLWVSLVASGGADQLGDANPEFRDAVATIAATVQGREKYELVADAVKEHRRAKRSRRLVMAGLALLAAGASVAAFIAVDERQTARRESNVASSRQLAATALANVGDNLQAALLLAVRAYRTDPNPQTRAALLQVNLASPKLERYVHASSEISATGASGDGRTVVAGTASGAVETWDPDGRRRRLFDAGGRVTRIAVDETGSVVLATDGKRGSSWRKGTGPRPIPVPAGQLPEAVAVSPNAETMIVHAGAAAGGGAASYVVISASDNRVVATHPAPSSAVGTVIRFGGPDTVLFFDQAYGGWERRRISTWKLLDEGSVGFGAKQAGGEPSADGEWITATNGDPEIPVWRTRGRPTQDAPDRVARAPISSATHLALSPDGSRLAAAGTGAVYVASAATPKAAPATPQTLPGNGSVDSLRFVGDSSHLLAVSSSALSLWDLSQTDRLARERPMAVGTSCSACSGPAASPSPDGRRLAVLDGNGASARVTEVSERGVDGPAVGSELGSESILGPPVWGGDGRVVHVPASPVAGAAETAAPDGHGELRPFVGGTGAEAVVTAALSRDSLDVMVVDARGAVHAHHPSDGRLRQTWPGPDELRIGARGLSSASIERESGLLAWILDGEVTVRDLLKGRAFDRVPGRDAAYVAFGGGNLLVQRRNGTVEVWDERGATLRRTLPGDPSYGWPVVADRASSLVARQRSDRSIAVVDAGNGVTFGVLPAPRGSRFAKVGVTFARGELLAEMVEPPEFRAPGRLLIRDLGAESLIRSACRAAGRDLRPREWRAFVGTTPPENIRCE